MDALEFILPTQYQNLGLVLDFSTYACVVNSSTLTHAIPLTLIADMCWLRVTTIVPYYGAMIRDHSATSEPRVSLCAMDTRVSTRRELVLRSAIMIHYSPGN